MEKLINSLKKLGLSRYESQAYIGLNKIITGQADEIAKVSDLPRSRIYDILKGLEEKGFVEIKRGRPLKYTVVEPSVIFKKQKEKLIKELETTENKLENIYTDEIAEVQAPVWLIHTPEKIIEKEVDLIKKTQKSITLRAGFLLNGESQAMIKAIRNNPNNIDIKILANPICYVEDEKIEIVETFKKAKLPNLKIIKTDLPMMKMLISDEKELIGTFAQFNGENNSVIPQTAIGVNNKYSAICKNFNDHFLRQFMKMKNMM